MKWTCRRQETKHQLLAGSLGKWSSERELGYGYFLFFFFSPPPLLPRPPPLPPSSSSSSPPPGQTVSPPPHPGGEGPGEGLHHGAGSGGRGLLPLLLQTHPVDVSGGNGAELPLTDTHNRRTPGPGCRTPPHTSPHSPHSVFYYFQVWGELKGPRWSLLLTHEGGREGRVFYGFQVWVKIRQTQTEGHQHNAFFLFCFVSFDLFFFFTLVGTKTWRHSVRATEIQRFIMLLR